MEAERDKVLQALQVAVKMEIDGKEFYLKASQESSNELSKKLLASLASEEDIHRQDFQEIYNAMRIKRAWPKTSFQSDKGKRPRTIFAEAIEVMGTNIETPSSELDTIKIAMDMENKTYDYYRNQSQIATYDAERDFYEALAAEEREHYLVLLDYHEYLSDPAGWFVQKEHPSLDGG